MDEELRKKLIDKARENGAKNGKVAELDFGAGAEWMYNELMQVKNTVDLGNETITQIVDKYRKTNITNKDFSDRLTKAKTI